MSEACLSLQILPSFLLSRITQSKTVAQALLEKMRDDRFITCGET